MCPVQRSAAPTAHLKEGRLGDRGRSLEEADLREIFRIRLELGSNSRQVPKLHDSEQEV